MTKILRTLSLTLTCCLLSAISQAAPQYPKINDVHGKVTLTDKDGKEAPAKKNQTLIEKATVQTGEDGQIVIQLDAQRQVRVLPGTRLEFPSISWETGDAPLLNLKNGSVRWKSKGRPYDMALSSDVFSFMPPVGDFVFKYNAKTALAEALAIEGTLEFSAMGAEDVALITSGQKVRFQGVIEGGEVMYDVLLKGRKIPRGKLGLAEPLSAADKKSFSAQKEKQEEAARIQKEQAAKKASEKPKDPNAICADPPARLDQCSWTCEGNPKKEKKVCHLEDAAVRCLRRRCNANGQWAEETEISKSKAEAFCGASVNVKACDY